MPKSVKIPKKGSKFEDKNSKKQQSSPRNIIIIDGNFAHGVTNVIDSITERFSEIIFCKWRREKLKNQANTLKLMCSCFGQPRRRS